ncbi:hypothetical protein BB559_006205 [Furculomyces boomerangus]|uniref:CDP-diacylglycerol--glycerol-3-phosphate 3-phosphatidyltransferase n=1 Tax=Furculomyces boomerangus TaxID=61424 RepID=A0A2T9Y499_9FUNG|nr:hypothetical protein BB559_006205 [Furculomyces boomerangus]
MMKKAFCTSYIRAFREIKLMQPSKRSFYTFTKSNSLGSGTESKSKQPDPFDYILPLTANKPIFYTNGNNIRVISTPSEFYETLKDNIRDAKRRIVLSTLYIGSTETELIETIESSLKQNPDLEVIFLFDSLRGTRKERSGNSTASLVYGLVEKFGCERVKAYLYHTPDLSGIKKKVYPARINETIGVQHIKAYVTDDKTIISGANLSRDYFTNRQDRYFMFSECSELSNYLEDLVVSISKFSYQLEKKTKFQKRKKDLEINYELVLKKECPNPHRSPLAFRKYSNGIMKKFLQDWKSIVDKEFSSQNLCNSSTKDTFIIPTIQMGPLGIYQDQEHTETLFEIMNNLASKYGQFYSDITSAYFNFADLHKNAILKSDALFNILIASPQANGFFGARGMSKYIPFAYTMFELDFLKQLVIRGREDKVQVYEYNKLGWTYHGKGIWCGFERCNPHLTVIGSSNLGERSLKRDLEAQFTIVTQNKTVQNELKSVSCIL